MSAYRSRNYSSRDRGYSGYSWERREARGGRPQRRTRQARPSQSIDASRYINKAVEEVIERPYEPTHRFSDFKIDERIKGNIARKGYETPTPIQDQSIPTILEGRDIVGIANTGTGKTGAFLIPLLDKVVKDRGERVLIMVPTRELAVQIEDEYRSFSEGSGFGSVCAVGGANINPQIRALRRDPYFVIGTPGRLKDLIERDVLDLSNFRTVVLDEADRMLDMGFIHDMRQILALMPTDRQTLFFSATLSKDIERLIGDFLNEPVRVSVKKGETSKNIEQDIVRLAGRNKADVLADMLASPEFEKVIVFGRTKHGVERLSKQLVQRGYRSASIHGNKSQNHRQRALDQFKKRDVTILCATDVAARGIDVEGVSHVINYDEPNTYEDYVHRIGRTGRAGKRGKALTFVD
ncbi:MAG TPA: DEAD/DEAH box helicase [Candidatus Paceibacterota bacterium]|nr:DEAD/DEAH box helicase [Candidatus Paceibacterota bacterium]